MDLLADVTERAVAAVGRWDPAATIRSVEPLTGGSSSLTFVVGLDGVADDDNPVVVKVAPPGLEPVRNRDVLRQARLLRALHGQPGVVVPRVLFEDGGDPPDRPPFFAMAFVAGDCLEPVLDADRDPARHGEFRARALDAATVLAAIHAVRPEAVGLAEPTVSLADEVDRWTRAFTTVPTDLQCDYERCAQALNDSLPTAMAAGVNHGDYRLGNALAADGRVMAVIDWEIWSVGDPRVDLAWMAYFTDEARHPAMPNHEPTGMPTAAELIDAYTAAGGSPLPDLDWFHALTRYKEAAATALLIKRARKASQMAPAMTSMATALPSLVEEAHEFLRR